MQTWLRYFWLLAIAVNGINAIIIWLRAQVYIKQQPELRSGYIKLIQGYMVGMSVPWVVMGIGLTGGGVSSIADYLHQWAGNPYTLAWWVVLWGLILLLSYWILFQGGAEMLAKHPGFLRGNPDNPKVIKNMWLILLFASAIASVVILSQHK